MNARRSASPQTDRIRRCSILCRKILDWSSLIYEKSRTRTWRSKFLAICFQISLIKNLVPCTFRNLQLHNYTSSLDVSKLRSFVLARQSLLFRMFEGKQVNIHNAVSQKFIAKGRSKIYAFPRQPLWFGERILHHTNRGNGRICTAVSSLRHVSPRERYMGRVRVHSFTWNSISQLA